MKKLIVAIVCLFAVNAHADLTTPVLVAAGSGGGITVLPVAVFVGGMVLAANTTPHPSLAASCVLKNVKKEGANYSFASHAHCK